MKWTTHMIARVLLYEYIGFFALAVAVAGFVRSASPFLLDTATEIAISLIGVLLFVGIVQAEIRLIKSGKPKRPPYEKRSIMIAGALTLVMIFGLPFVHFIPQMVSMILLAGAEFGGFLLRIVDAVFGGKFGLDWVKEVFIAIPWIVQFVMTLEVVQWVRNKRNA